MEFVEVKNVTWVTEKILVGRNMFCDFIRQPIKELKIVYCLKLNSLGQQDLMGLVFYHFNVLVHQ